MLAAEEMHVKNKSLGAKRLSGCHGDCVQQRRRDEDEIARGNVIVLQLDLIGAAPGENARKFRFLVPVCADGRVQIVECGDIFLQWKSCSPCRACSFCSGAGMDVLFMCVPLILNSSIVQ